MSLCDLGSGNCYPAYALTLINILLSVPVMRLYWLPKHDFSIGTSSSWEAGLFAWLFGKVLVLYFTTKSYWSQIFSLCQYEQITASVNSTTPPPPSTMLVQWRNPENLLKFKSPITFSTEFAGKYSLPMVAFQNACFPQQLLYLFSRVQLPGRKTGTWEAQQSQILPTATPLPSHWCH